MIYIFLNLFDHFLILYSFFENYFISIDSSIDSIFSKYNLILVIE